MGEADRFEWVAATEDDEPALNSLFSSNLIETISNEALKARYATPPPSPPQRHARGVGESIRVGVALTNLNGVGYGYPVTPGGEFVYVDYGDQLTREVVGSSCDNADFWEPLHSCRLQTFRVPRVLSRPPSGSQHPERMPSLISISVISDGKV